MNSVIAEFGGVGKETQINRFFLACECKPGSPLFSVIDPFAYDVEPAYIFGGLGTLHYDPPSYSIISISDDNEPLFGYILTITHEDTIALLDRLKGFYGHGGFNYHLRISGFAMKEEGEPEKVWIYVATDNVVSVYETIEQIDRGIWNEDDTKLIEFAEKIEQEMDEEEDDEDDETVA